MTAETPITDQVPLDWLLTVTSKLERESEGGRRRERERKSILKARQKFWLQCDTGLHRKPEKTNVKQSLTSALAERRER